MRKLITLIALVAATVSASAQETVYFGSLSKNTSIGVGFSKGTVTLSVMEVNKKKTAPLAFAPFDMDENPIKLSMQVDTVYHLDLGDETAHQKDYTLTIGEYQKLKRSLDSQSYALINGKKYNGASVVGLLTAIETEQTRFLKGTMSIRKVSLWNLNRGMEMMRFRQDAIKRFNYVRTSQLPLR